MWALRSASLPLRSRGCRIRASSVACPSLERLISDGENKTSIFDSPELASEKCLYSKGFYRENHFSANMFLIRRCLSSQTGVESSKDENDLEEGFSELESEDSVKAGHGSNAEDIDEDELISELDVSDEDDVSESAKNELERPENEVDLSEKLATKKKFVSVLYNVIAHAKGMSISSALDKWAEQGNEVDREEVSAAMLLLRKFRTYAKALEFSEWLQSRKKIEFLERDYSSRLDLIAKVHGPEKAQTYFGQIPSSFRGLLVYQTLLNSYVQPLNVKKAEETFNKIKDFELPLSSFACDQMLFLYKRCNQKKMAEILLLMEKENVKPSLFTYRLLVDTKGSCRDIEGMEQILETMKADGIEPDLDINCTLVRHYFSAGLEEKAKAIMKEMETTDLTENRHLCRYLIGLYADLGLEDEVERIWKVCESEPRVGESLAAIEGFGKLKRVEKAEAIFENMLKGLKKPTMIHYNKLLKVYADNKMLIKGKNLMKVMAERGCHIGPVTWDLMVKLYVDAGEIEKADSVLNKVFQQKKEKPLFSSYIAIMEQYARRGDIHNAESIYLRLKQAGYSPRVKQFHTLIKAYVNAKAPLYAVRDRMKADNIIPTKGLLVEMQLVDAFRKTAVSHLLD